MLGLQEAAQAHCPTGVHLARQVQASQALCGITAELCHLPTADASVGSWEYPLLLLPVLKGSPKAAAVAGKPVVYA